jgi:hypothetical protein
MAVAVTIRTIQNLNDSIRVSGTLVLSGNYPGNPGETLSFAAAAQAGLAIGSVGVPSTEAPLGAVMIAGRNQSALVSYTPGASRDVGKLRVFSAVATEIAGGAYGAGPLADTFDFDAYFRKLI